MDFLGDWRSEKERNQEWLRLFVIEWMVVSVMRRRGKLREDCVEKKIKIDREEKRIRGHISRSNILPGICVVLKYTLKIFATPLFKWLSLIPFSLSVGWT